MKIFDIIDQPLEVTAKVNEIESELQRLLAPLKLAEHLFIASWDGAKLSPDAAIHLSEEFMRSSDAYQLRLKPYFDQRKAEALALLHSAATGQKTPTQNSPEGENIN